MNLESKTANPYVGLRPFEQEDSLYFFGRREQTAALLDQLHRSRFLAVVGSSGCGKSSLIRAGLIPSLLGGFLVEERDTWQIAIMKPGDAPLRNLAAALCQALDKAPSNTSIIGLHDALVADHTPAVISYVRSRLGANTSLLLLIDQFEELFSFREADDEELTLQLNPQQRRQRARRRAEADDFVDLVLGLKAAIHLPIYTVLTMRTDFLGDCDLFYGLPEAMNECRYLVPRLSRQQLRLAIEGPARLAETSIAPRLLDRLLNQLGDRADRLPVLQHALLRTWDIWRRAGADGPMDLEHYAAAGTLQNALSQHADEALRLSDHDTTAKIFKCLTATDAQHRRVRRPARLSELAAVAEQPANVILTILERFCEDGRNFLVMSASADADDPRVDISHESLIRQWDTLKDWVDEERVSRDQWLDLVHRGHGYRRGERALLWEPELQIALDWRATTQPTAAWAKRYSTRDDDFDVAMQYLEQSRLAKEKAVKRRRRLHLLIWVATIAAFTLPVLIPVISDIYHNLYSNYFYLNTKEGFSGNIELHRGRSTSWDIFNFKKYITETDYQRSQIEPSQLFSKIDINNYDQKNSDLIEVLKPVEKIESYWHHGETDKVYSEIPSYIRNYPERKYDAIDIISNFRSLDVVNELKENLLDKEMKDIHETIVDMMAMLPTPTTMATLLSEIKTDGKYAPRVRHAMVEALESIGHADFTAGHTDQITSVLASLGERSSPEDAEQRVRLRAAQASMWLGDQGAVNTLISLAQPGRDRIRREAIEALAESRDDRVVEFLRDALNKTKNPYVRRRVVQAFAQMGGADVVETLIKLINDGSVRIRQSAVHALGQTGSPGAVEPLMKRLQSEITEQEEEEDELGVQRSIVEALGRLGHDSKSVTFLLDNVLLADDNSPYADDRTVRVTAEALERVGNAKTYEALADKMHDERLSRSKQGVIVDLMGRLGDKRAADPLKAVLANNGANRDGVSQKAAEALGRLGEASVAVEPLLDLLDAATDRMQLNVVSALGRLGHRKALDSLRKKVEKPTVDRQDIIYLGALAALGQLKDARVLDDLTTWLQQGDILMRRGNLESLLGPSMAGSIERRIASSMGEEGDVRQAAVEVLGEFDSIRPVDLLLARLSDGSIFVRRGATRALGQLGKRDIRVVERLMVHLHDSDSGVRQNAAEALSYLGGSRAVLPLIALLQDRDGDVRQEAAKALGRLGDGRALEPLLSLLRGAKDRRQDGVEDVRRAALLAAAKIGLKSDPARIEYAARAIFNNDKCDPAASEHTVCKSERMRLAATVVLLALPQPHASPDPEVEAFLGKYADRSQAISIRKELAEMLGDFPTARGQSLLLKWLDDTNLNVQESVLKALGQAKVQDVLPRLHEQLRSANFRIQKAAAEALAEIASAASLDELAAIASASKPKVEVSIPTRLASLQALYHITNKNSKDDKVRETVIKNMLAAVESEADQAILGMRAYKLLGDLQARQALDPLQERLQEQVKRLHQWRHAREASQDSTQPSRDMLEEAKLARHLAFELAYNIARIDPRASGLSLLSHDLAEIRQGAWKGVGSVGNAALITELHEWLKNSDQSWFEKLWDNDKPFFRPAAYQAIDHILLRLEAEDVTPKEELERLKELASGASGTLCDHQGRPEEQGICKRVEWTIAQLEAHQPL